MVQINKRLLPIKAHYLLFMAAMGPILPQLPVIGKQIGISPEIMGYITSVLPIMYVIAKPVFGFIADYFVRLRKYIFLLLIACMTLSFGAFYIIPKLPNTPNNAIDSIDNPLNTVFSLNDIESCTPEMLTSIALSTSTRKAVCSSQNESFNFTSYFIDLDTELAKTLNLTQSNVMPASIYMCLPSKSKNELLNDRIYELGLINSTCLLQIPERSDNNIYGTWTFWLFVILMCSGTIGFNTVNSISDAVCFDMLGDADDHKYGSQRVWGTIGFGLTALISGIVVNLWTVEEEKSFTPALIIMLIFSGLDMLNVLKLKLPKLSSSESIFKDVWELVTHPSIAIFMVFAVIAGIIDSFIIYFMFWHLEEVAIETGYLSQIKLIEGLVVAAECLAGEVPFFFYSGKIIKKLGYVHCMSMCFFFYAIRLALISWIPNPWYLVGVEFFFQGCTYALCYTCIVAYAAAVAPPGASATVQGIMAGMDDGLGYSIGSLIGGLAFKAFGGRRSFAYFSILAICTCIAHIIIRPTSRKQQYLPKTGYTLPKEQNDPISIQYNANG